MQKAQNIISKGEGENNNSNITFKDNEEAFAYMSKLKRNNKGYCKMKAMGLFEKENKEFLLKNPQENSKFENIIKNNMLLTKKESQVNYWNKLKSIFANIKKTNVVYNFPKLPFGDSLEDLDFLLLVQDSINYICYFQTNEFLVYIKDLLGKIENYTQNIFIFPNILKDIKKNGILNIIMSQTYKEINDSLELIQIDACTITPLIKLKFEKDNKNYDLDKKELKDIMTSNIILRYLRKNLFQFINSDNQKLKDKNKLKESIETYINNFNIYFCNLPTDTLAVTIYTGNVYLKSKYLKEYFNTRDDDNINTDNMIIIREKIVLNYKHEMNHALVRILDDDKANNFFLKSKNNKKTKNLEFKDKLDNIKKFNFSQDESGTCFDYKFFRGYYFDNLMKHEANFFLEVKNMKDKNEYKQKFDEMINNKKAYIIIDSSINKFKKLHDRYNRCLRP